MIGKNISEFGYTDWFDAAKLAKELGLLSGVERRALYNFGKTLRNGKILSDKQLSWGKKILSKLEIQMSSSNPAPKYSTGDITMNNTRHITARMAWHDSNWNGKICKDPGNNSYCVGDYSLLSSRIRNNRKLDLENITISKRMVSRT